MRKGSIIFFFLVLLVSCGPVEDEKMPFYKLVYSTTVQVHKYERLLQTQVEELLSRQRNDSVFYEGQFLQAITDSNQALIARIERAINVLSDVPDDNSYNDIKTQSIRILRAQKMYQSENVYALIRACEDGVISVQEILIPVVTREAYASLSTNYARWKLLRDEYIRNLELSDAELTDLKLRYGSD